MEAEALLRTFVEAVNARDWDRLDDLVAVDFVRHSHAAGPPGVRSRDDLKRFLRAEYTTFPDAHETIEDLFAAGAKVAVRHGFRGTQLGPLGPYPPSGRVLVADYLAIYRVADGQIAEAWVEWDNLSTLVKLGHQPGEPPREPPPTALATTPTPPYFAVIFTSIRTGEDADSYAAMAQRMVELAATMLGFLGIESVRGPDGVGITVSYWASEEAIRAWQAHAEHREAQRLGRDRWYGRFELRVCRVERAYGFANTER